jgi:hypothetical protein
MKIKSKYLKQETLVNLKNYKYVSGEYSLLDNLLTPFWNTSVQYLPIWMAPNLVTLIGLSFSICNWLMYFP